MIVADRLIPLLTFRLAKQYYALHIDNVLEVAAMVTVTELPNTAPAFLGMANRHGSALAMIDMRLAFNLSASAINTSTLFVVAKADDNQVGLVVDEIFQVKYIQGTAFSTSHGAGQHISHIISDGDKLYQLLNLKSLLSAYLSHIET
jgi:purine-binding chemotaxis protein CheW